MVEQETKVSMTTKAMLSFAVKIVQEARNSNDSAEAVAYKVAFEFDDLRKITPVDLTAKELESGRVKMGKYHYPKDVLVEAIDNMVNGEEADGKNGSFKIGQRGAFSYVGEKEQFISASLLVDSKLNEVIEIGDSDWAILQERAEAKPTKK